MLSAQKKTITVNKQLFPSKATCKLMQYMSNKPVKFRKKMCYLLTLILNTSTGFPNLKISKTGNPELHLSVVTKLTEPI